MSMAPVADVLHVVSPAVADVLVASVWQSLLLTGAVALCFRLIPRVPAGTRSGLWTAVLVLIVLLPAISMLVPHSFGIHGRAVHVAADWSLSVVCFWALLSLFRLGQLGLSAARLRTLTQSAEPVELDVAIAPLLKLGSRTVLLCSSSLVDRPSVIGFLRPRILLSPELLRSLSGAELEQIVLHEMEHLRRGDHWTNLLQQVSLVLLPWNPAVLWLNRRLSLERELACDDGVLRATKARKTYAACLVRLAEESMIRRGLSLTLGVLGPFEARARESELVKRVRRILTPTEPGVAPGFLRVAIGGVLAGALGLSLLLARSPRLVEFGSGQTTVAATVAGADPAEAPALAVDRTDGADGSRATLVKAVVPGSSRARCVMTRAVVTQSALHKVAVHLAVHHGARRMVRPAPAVEVPVWRERIPITRPVLTLASIEDSQQLYAAVPWQGGWLLIQL
jgi:hypothetical protein